MARKFKPRLIELKIKNPKKIYQELASILSLYREELPGSILFIIEGIKQKPIIAIRYPGKKLKRRVLKVIRSNSALLKHHFTFEQVKKIIPLY